MKKSKIAILYICTGDYVIFWKPFYESFKKYFLLNSRVEYFVFTDAENLVYHTQEDVHVIHQGQLEWPYSTLMRFDMFLRAEKQLTEFDYVFYFNANMICLDYVREEEFLPIANQLLVTKHPACYLQDYRKLEYERNPESTAYVKNGTEKIYVQGALEGGKTIPFMEMVRELSACIHDDLERHIIAVWHDESHLNHYIISHMDYKLLTPVYMYPQNWNLPMHCKIYLFEKNMILDLHKIKGGSGTVRQGALTEKFRGSYNIAKQLYYIRKKGSSLAEYLSKVQLKNIAIYGYKDMGELLLDELAESNIEVKYIIDRAEIKPHGCIPIIKPQEISAKEKVDCIIVSCVQYIFQVYTELTNQVDCRVLPADYVVHEAYMDCVEKDIKMNE